MASDKETTEHLLPSPVSPRAPAAPHRVKRKWTYTRSSGADLCPQVGPVYPTRSAELWKSLGKTYGSSEFLLRAVDWLGGAVRVPTESYDKMAPVGEDSRWEAFGPFHDYLLQAYPLVHTTLTLTKVNTYGLLFEWKGTNDTAKPLLLLAHQDVVPVDPTTADQWKHPPYSGHFDGERVWGRGSLDDKSGLIGILSAVESLLEANFTPTRSIVLSFGFDEEASGLHGAQKLSEYILTKYGENAFALLIDEGGGYQDQAGSAFAIPAIAEKGYLDTRITVASPGGHSSVPPPHTSIGILARLLVEFEAHPIKSHLERATPAYDMVQCIGAHGKDIDPKLRKALEKSAHSNRALRAVEKILFQEPVFESLVGTTQAIDLIQGGVKSNALPEEAWAVVNHRIATQSSLKAVQERDTDLLKHLAHKFNLTYTAFGASVSPQDGPAYGTLELADAWGTALGPAPVTPTDQAPFLLLSGTIKATYNAYRGIEGDNIVVSPGIMSGNTDTRFYWKLTEHIIRYDHYNNNRFMGEQPPGVHTVNEYIYAKDFVEMISFYTTLILNVDEATDF
ncbi:carboxypeptidase S [Auriscalpium vulgare]|uniref:Carboxypeptidase S n=1 Tax=Auriscalpium vulgare TaxID=40419 RepID=A0ACB8R4F3_9AGAM|nr:carboxypeptidase S [Auriscalpium vulgare]